MMTMIMSTMYFLMLTINSINPMKMSVLMVLMSSMAMLWIHSLTGKTWFPCLMYLMFMGGVLMMFMILSATMPNEKMKKSSGSTCIILLGLAPVLAMQSTLSTSEETAECLNQVKMFMSESSNLSFVLLMMLVYFMIFISMISKNKNSMRSSS